MGNSRVTPTPRKRNPKRINSLRWYVARRGEMGRSLRNSYRGNLTTHKVTEQE